MDVVATPGNDASEMVLCYFGNSYYIPIQSGANLRNYRSLAI